MGHTAILTSGHATCFCSRKALLLRQRPEEGNMVSFKKILFPTDFSANAHHALLHAMQLADFHKGELIVQHVVTDYFEKHSHWATLFDIHEMQKYLDGYADTEM